MKINYCFAFILYVLFSLNDVSGQKRFTEDEIKAEDAYLAAQLEVYKGRHDKAIPLFLDIYKKNRTNGDVTFQLAKSYESIEDYPNADKYASISIRLMPDNIWVLLHYAKLMVKMEKYEDGAKAFKLLDIKDPEDRSHIENHAKCLISARNEKEAISQLDAWEVRNGIHEPLIKLKYDIYRDRGDEKRAEKELYKLVNSSPKSTRFLNNLATFYKQTGDVKAAKDIYLKILDIDPNDTKANAGIMTMVEPDEKDASYLRSLLPLIEKQDIDPDTKIKELLPYIVQMQDGKNPGLNASMLQLTQSLVLIHPDDAKCHALRGDVLNLSHQAADAIAAYEKTLKLDDTIYEVWRQLLYLIYEQNDYSKLEKTSYDAMDIFPNQAENYFFNGIALNEKNSPDEAMEILNEGMLISGNNLSYKSNISAELSRSYFMKGNTTKANELIESSLELSQGLNPIALEVKGDILAAQGNMEEATVFWKKAKELGSTRNSLTKKISQ